MAKLSFVLMLLFLFLTILFLAKLLSPEIDILPLNEISKGSLLGYSLICIVLTIVFFYCSKKFFR